MQLPRAPESQANDYMYGTWVALASVPVSHMLGIEVIAFFVAVVSAALMGATIEIVQFYRRDDGQQPLDSTYTLMGGLVVGLALLLHQLLSGT